MLNTLFLLLAGHALADFALQSTEMAKGKNRHNITTPPPGQKYVPCWPYWLSAHAIIHGLAVYLVTDSLTFGLIETAAHWIIDFIKCEGKTTPHEDQALHLACKIIYSSFI